LKNRFLTIEFIPCFFMILFASTQTSCTKQANNNPIHITQDSLEDPAVQITPEEKTGRMTDGFKQESFDHFQHVTENGGVTITGYTGNARDIVIPRTINGMPVTAIGRDAFSRKKLASVTFPDTVTVIGAGAFFSNRLTELTLPGSVTTIENLAFSYNRLKNVNLPDSLESIGIRAFADNRLDTIYLPDSLEYIGDAAFIRNLFDDVTVPAKVLPFNSRVFDFYVNIFWR